MADQTTNNLFNFKPSDILSLGSMFFPDKGGTAAPGASVIDTGIDAGINAAMMYNQSNIGGPTKYQKNLSKASAGFDAATTAISFIPGVGKPISLALQGLNWATGKIAPKANKIELGERVGQSSGYAGTAKSIGEQTSNIQAYNKSGGFAKLFGNRGRLNDITKGLTTQQKVANDILKQSNKQLSATGMGAQNINSMNNILFNGFSGNEIRAGKQGMKLEQKEFLDRIFKTEVPTLEEGGKINVIVNGKLHKENHDLHDTELVSDIDITKKGIPVVVMEEGGEVTEQAAEVERDELVLYLELTKKLEELEKEGTEEAMIEAGKILAKELIKNTRDSKSKIIKNA